MTSADIIAIEAHDPFPRAQVLDLAIGVAIGRELASNERDMFSLIEDWFLRPASKAELHASVSRLIDLGWAQASSDEPFDLCLTEKGVDATATLAGGMIRMIDRGRGLLKTSFLLQSLDLEKGKCP